MSVTRNEGVSGVLIGWFHHTSRGWRTTNSLAFRADGNGDTFWLFFEYGTRNVLTGGKGCFEGQRYQTTASEPFAGDGSTDRWQLQYDPNGNKGIGSITFRVDKQQVALTLAKEDRARGAIFDRFGLFDVQSGGWHVEAYFDDLRYSASSSRKSP